MKTLGILFLTIFTAITSFATPVEPTTATLEGQTITVYFDSEKSETVTVSIQDNAGYVLITDKVATKNRKSRGYNLEQLPYGIYTVEIESDQKIIYKTIKTDKNNSIVLDEEVTFKPTTIFQDNKWRVNLLALGKTVDIKILDANLESVFEQKIKDHKVIAKSYNLNNLDYGVYTLSVRIGENSYNKVIAKM